MLPAAIGRYEILGELATGGMAEILLGRVTGQGGFERPVVIKRILPHLARQKTFVAMFLDEARIVAQIRHPNVVHVQELGQEGDELYLVMEYLEGESLAGLVKRLLVRQRTLEPTLAAHLVAEACAGLHAAHELADAEGTPQNLVHRDVSPQNVFLTYQGQVKVIDFGVAKAADRIARTEAGQIKGKYEYMAPEQCLGEPIDRRADVFALGVLFYELLTMRRLFKRFNQYLAVKAITTEPIVPPSRVVADGAGGASPIPAALEAVAMRALARKPGERYASAAELRRELLAAVRALGGPDEPTEALAKLMRDLFLDRIEEKRELLRTMRDGSRIVHVPVGEADTAVDVPGLEPESTNLGTETGSAIDTPVGVPRRRPPIAAIIVAGVLVAVAGAIPFVGWPPRGRAPAVAAPPATTATEAASAAEPVPSTTTATATATANATATTTATATATTTARRRAPPSHPPAAAPPPPPPAPPPPPPPDPAPAASKGFHRFQ